MGTLKGSTGRFFNCSAQNRNFIGHLVGSDLPYSFHSVKNQFQQKALIYTSFERQFDTDHFLLKELVGLGSTLVVMCCQIYWWRHNRKSYILPVKTIDILAWIVPGKLNYESKEDRQGSNASSLLKMTPQEMLEAALRPVLWRRYWEIFSQSDLSKFLAIFTIRKPNKEVIFGKPVNLKLSASLRKWTFSNVFFLKIRCFTEKV